MTGRGGQADAEDNHRLWFFPFAALVLKYERMLPHAERRRHRHGHFAVSNLSADRCRPRPAQAPPKRAGRRERRPPSQRGGRKGPEPAFAWASLGGLSLPSRA